MSNIKINRISPLGVNNQNTSASLDKVSRLGLTSTRLSEEYKDNFSPFSTINIKLLINHLRTDFLKINPFDAKKYIDNNFKKFEKEDVIEKLSVKKDNIETKKIKIFTQKEKDFNQLQEQIENDAFTILAKSISLNETISYIDNDISKNSYSVNIDFKNKIVDYRYSIYYTDTKGVIERTSTTVKANDKYRAIIARTASVETLFFFVEKVYGKDHANNIRLYIFEQFKLQLEKANDIDTLAFLYKNLPRYIKLGYDDQTEIEKKPYKLLDDLLWKHFQLFANFDKGLDDASYYVINTMTLITPEFCIKKFLEDQKFVRKIYNSLNDQKFHEALFGLYEFSKTFETGTTTFEPTNKDCFVSLLHTYAQLLEPDKELSKFESEGTHFHQGTKRSGKNDRYPDVVKYSLHTNSIFDIEGDDEKVYLYNYWESTRYKGTAFVQQGESYDPYEYHRGFYPNGYFNPLDVVKFTRYNDKGEEITMNTYAIFVKHAADVKKREVVNEGLRLGLNILMIAGGLATIASGTGSLLLYAAIADMGLASADIIIQVDKDKDYFKTEEGREFLESWEKIYTVGSVATLSPVAIKFVATYAPKLVRSGARLLQVPGKIINNLEVLERVEKLTTKAIYSLEIPNFNKRGLEILKVGFTEFAELKNAEKLQKLGVIFVKGGENTVAAIYKGVTIASGTPRIVFLQLRKALEKLKGKLLEEYLEKRYRYLGGATKDLPTNIDVDWFLASAERLASLNITAETALKYLDEALIHFNHYVKDGVVYRIGSENCASTAKVLDEYLRTGKITKAENIGVQGFEYFGKTMTDFPQLSLPSLEKVMKDGERGIIWGQLPTLKSNIRYMNGELVEDVLGHYFNVIKIDGKLIYYDPQIGRYAVIRLKYKAFRYSKTN